ncbi:MAG: MarR family transcriptional regulator [Ferruginibacter sp.]|nr:MarR family transcriptional regulator [Cytophagales bacterium]
MKAHQTVDFHLKSGWLAISRMYNAKAAKHDMTMSIGYVLLNIDLEKGTPATKIAPTLGLEPRSLTRMLKSLEEKGWINRSGSEHDKRFVNIHLTDKGRFQREIARRTVIEFNQQVLQHISIEKLTVFFEVIGDINRVVESLVVEERLTLEENNAVG